MTEGEVCPDDATSSINCLAVRPGRIIAPSGLSPRTLDRLDRAGIEVIPLEYEKVYSGGGGIHCSTAPLLREAV